MDEFLRRQHIPRCCLNPASGPGHIRDPQVEDIAREPRRPPAQLANGDRAATRHKRPVALCLPYPFAIDEQSQAVAVVNSRKVAGAPLISGDRARDRIKKIHTMLI